MENESPKLARRSLNKKSTIKLGRTIAEKREKLETASERALAHKKQKKKKLIRIILTVAGFIAIVIILIILFSTFSKKREEEPEETVYIPYAPTIEVIDEDSASTGGRITSRMREYIGKAENEFRNFGYTPIKAVVPSGSIREVDFYLDGYTGFIKLIIDREVGVSVEDADRMLRYLIERGITDFTYVDVRVERKGFFK